MGALVKQCTSRSTYYAKLLASFKVQHQKSVQLYVLIGSTVNIFDCGALHALGPSFESDIGDPISR